MGACLGESDPVAGRMAPTTPPKTSSEAAPADPQGTADEGFVARIRASAALLESIVEDRGLLAGVPREDRERLLMAAGRVSRPTRHERKALGRARLRNDKLSKRSNDEMVLATTGIRKLRDSPVFQTPRRIALFEGREPERLEAPSFDSTEAIGSTHEERRCYVCRKTYREVHHFYDQMCLDCGDLSFSRRERVADLRGRVALVTGARVKIGYQAAIKLLRAGCSVVVTTRFPRDAARRYAAEVDFEDWGDRLQIHGIDLRHTPSVEALCAKLNGQLDRLDFIINNACQTVRRPPGFYEHMMELELDPSKPAGERELRLLAPDEARPATGTDMQLGFGDAAAVLPSAALSQVELLAEDGERGEHLFPTGRLDADLQQVDLRKVNSWRLKLAEVPTIELLEVHLVNAVAPFVINARMKGLMSRVPTADKHIVNVSAMEGQFYRFFKTDKHPHTNMAKASLNMMTRTSAADYVEHGIHMNCVDTGWVTDEDPMDHAEAKREMHRFHPPLDIVDGAARIVDPIFDGFITGEHVWGQFLKDYKITDW